MKPSDIGILIVDDEASVRDALFKWFKFDGYRVDAAVIAHSGAAGQAVTGGFNQRFHSMLDTTDAKRGISAVRCMRSPTE